MEIKEIPFNQTMLKKAAGEDEIEYYNINQRDENGGRTLELKITDSEGRRKVVVLADRGFCIEAREVELKPFSGREERNREIWRLYNEEHLTQVFLANLFSITQPSVSLIIKQMKENNFTGTLKFKMAFKVLFLLMAENRIFYYFCGANKYFTKK